MVWPSSGMKCKPARAFRPAATLFIYEQPCLLSSTSPPSAFPPSSSHIGKMPMSRLLVAVAFLFVSLTSFSQSFTTQGYPAGAGVNQVIQADFNGDHIPDLATVNNSSNTVSILINNGDGTFRAHTEYATGPGPIALAAVDFNKDGKMDLVVANNQADAAHSVSILIGNG